MLVLARRVGEEIVIGDDIRVTVLEVRGRQARLGVVAPPSVRVLRQEIESRRVESVSSPLGLSKAGSSGLSESKIMAGLIRVAQ